MARTNTFRTVTQVFVSREISPAAQAQRLIDVAHAGRDALIANGQATPNYTTAVDGTIGAPEAGVRRTIAYNFNFLGDAVAFALGYLVARSPVLTGEFSNSFVVAVNGDATPAVSFDPTTIPPGAEIIIFNPQPYSRKIDVQFIGNKPIRFSVPAGLFSNTVTALKQRFGNTITASRITDTRFPGQWVQERGPNKGRLVTSPGVLITSR